MNGVNTSGIARAPQNEPEALVEVAQGDDGVHRLVTDLQGVDERRAHPLGQPLARKRPESEAQRLKILGFGLTLEGSITSPGMTRKLLAYCEHLRQIAAGRDPDGQLAEQRTRLAREQADRVAMQNAIQRREYMPVQLLEEVLANISRQVATQLDSVLPEVLRRFPYLSGEPARFIEQRLAAAREAAASAEFNPSALETDSADDEEATA